MLEMAYRTCRPVGASLCRAGVAAALFAGPALAAPPPLSVPVSTEDANNTTVSTGLLGTLQRSNFLLGDLFGLRTALSRYGISLAIQETSEVLGNPVGGPSRGRPMMG